jgi:predicted alpha/beta hydrolase family esterase
MDTNVIIPGLNGSGPDHWQSWFEAQVPNCVRVVQTDWEDPTLSRWSGRVCREINRAPGRVYLIAHSFGCLAAVETAINYRELIAGLMLVAPADPERFGLGSAIADRPLRVPAVVVASTNDPWMSYARAAHYADAWDADLINLGAAGHINVASGFGAWQRGLSIFKALQRSSAPARTLHVADHHRQI